MITSLSWQDYFLFTGIILAIYFLVVYALFYWQEIKGIVLYKRFSAVTKDSVCSSNSATHSDDEHLNLFNRPSQPSKTSIKNAVAHNIQKD